MCTGLFLFLSLWHTNNPSLMVASWCVTVHRQQLTLPKNDNRQQAYSPETASSLCVFMRSVRPGRPSVAECPPQPEQTRQDRTSHFLQPPLVKLPIFTPVALELLCLSLWTASWWHSGQQSLQAKRRKPGVRKQWGGVDEQIKREATEKRLIQSQTLCLTLFSLVLVELQTYISWAATTMLTSILFMFICCCLLKSNVDRAGSNVVVLPGLRGVRDLPSTLPWAWLNTDYALAQHVEHLSDSPQVSFTTVGSQSQRTWLYFKFRLSVPRAKLLT